MLTELKWQFKERWYMRPRSKADVKRWATETFICHRKGHIKSHRARLYSSGSIETKTYCKRCKRLLDWNIEQVPYAKYLKLEESRVLCDTGENYHDYR